MDNPGVAVDMVLPSAVSAGAQGFQVGLFVIGDRLFCFEASQSFPLSFNWRSCWAIVLIEGWSNPRAWTILDARSRSPICGRVAGPLLGRRSRGSLPRLPLVRKRSAVTGTLVGVRLQADQIKAIDAWAVKQNPPVSRPEAIATGAKRGSPSLALDAALVHTS